MTSNAAEEKRPYIGGQAVIEGVMMRSPKSFVVAVRRYDGQIAIRERPWHVLLPSLRFLRWPVFRGAVVLAESLHNGFSALNFSAEHGLPPEEQGKKPTGVSASTLLSFLPGALAAAAEGEPSAAPPGPQPAPAKKSDPASTAMLVIATAVMVAFFIGLPHLLTWLLGKAVGPSLDTKGVWFHVVDGVMRLLILVGYIWAISKTKDAKRLFEYHGAEHKAIWTYESKLALTVENAAPFTTRHPRCGTSFLFIVVGVAVVLHVVFLPLLPRLHENDLLNQLLMVLIKVPMAFPIAGLAYELQRWSARPSCPRVVTGMMKPGLWLQTITTQPPSPEQLQIALLSLSRALAREEGKPKGPDGATIYASFEQAAA